MWLLNKDCVCVSGHMTVIWFHGLHSICHLDFSHSTMLALPFSLSPSHTLLSTSRAHAMLDACSLTHNRRFKLFALICLLFTSTHSCQARFFDSRNYLDVTSFMQLMLAADFTVMCAFSNGKP